MCVKNRKASGYTFVELMVSIAIVSILSVMGMNQYQDYLIKVRATEALLLADSAKKAVTENAVMGAAFASGWRAPNPYPPYVKLIWISPSDGVIVIRFNAKKVGQKFGVDYDLWLSPKDAGVDGLQSNYLTGWATGSQIPLGQILWSCRSEGTTGIWSKSNFPAKWAPEACKGTAYRQGE